MMIVHPEQNLPKFFCSRGCSDKRIFWKILLLNILGLERISTLPEEYLRMRRYICCLRRFYKNIKILQKIYLLCEENQNHPKEDKHLLQNINHLLHLWNKILFCHYIFCFRRFVFWVWRTYFAVSVFTADLSLNLPTWSNTFRRVKSA
jgi:hypothetical protein